MTLSSKLVVFFVLPFTLVSFDFLSICSLQAVFSLSSAAVSISKAMGGISKS